MYFDLNSCITWFVGCEHANDVRTQSNQAKFACKHQCQASSHKKLRNIRPVVRQSLSGNRVRACIINQRNPFTISHFPCQPNREALDPSQHVPHCNQTDFKFGGWLRRTVECDGWTSSRQS
eukprot:m.237991 g.237991  ORF g.237991 m.237991 type:complete len:121 (-) comp15281_c0_seq3:3553-3915(-)